MMKIDPQQLRQRLDQESPPALLDVLSSDAFDEMHLPGARNACVYEVSFLEQVEKAVPDKATEIVVYGSRATTRDAADAIERLRKAGYENVCTLEGGRVAWQDAGLPFEGSRYEPRPAAAVTDGAYAVDAEKSVVDWTGRNVGGGHFGTLQLTGGRVVFQGGVLRSGEFEIDMRTIRVADLEGEPAKILIRHLEHDDFFAVADHPTAHFEITNARPRADAAPGTPNYDLEGTLTLRGVRNGLEFPASVYPKAGLLTLEAHFDLDRTRWEVNYGSGKLYDRLGMHLVNDHVSLQVRLHAHAASST